MKSVSYFLLLLLSCSGFLFSSCSDDDDDEFLPQPPAEYTALVPTEMKITDLSTIKIQYDDLYRIVSVVETSGANLNDPDVTIKYTITYDDDSALGVEEAYTYFVKSFQQKEIYKNTPEYSITHDLEFSYTKISSTEYSVEYKDIYTNQLSFQEAITSYKELIDLKTGNPLSKELYDIATGELRQKSVYEYDSKGNMVKLIVETAIESGGTGMYTSTSTYDNMNGIANAIKTPKWLLLRLPDPIYMSLVNNKTNSVYTWKYNDYGYPVSRVWNRSESMKTTYYDFNILNIEYKKVN